MSLRPMYRLLPLLAFFALFLSPEAQAHTGAGMTSGGSLMAGLLHPFTGLDHMLAMIAVGLWAAQASGRFIWQAPVTFMSAMLIGGAVGAAAPALMAPFELGITGSVMAFGLALAAAWNPAPAIGMALCGLFALFHGHAHGAEMGVTASPVLYSIGFIAATGSMHLFGIALARNLQQAKLASALRFMGAGLTAAGVALFVM